METIIPGAISGVSSAPFNTPPALIAGCGAPNFEPKNADGSDVRNVLTADGAGVHPLVGTDRVIIARTSVTWARPEVTPVTIPARTAARSASFIATGAIVRWDAAPSKRQTTKFAPCRHYRTLKSTRGDRFDRSEVAAYQYFQNRLSSGLLPSGAAEKGAVWHSASLSCALRA